MADLHPELRKKYAATSQRVREHINSGGNFDRWTWPLHGKNAIVAPGKSIVIRLLPRWDAFVLSKENKWVPNPAYASAPEPIYFEALEHWWEDSSKQRQREWCRKTFDRNEKCPTCENVAELQKSGADDDGKAAKDQVAKVVFLFNACLGITGKRKLGEDKKVEIRALPASNTIYSAIIDLMMGATDESGATIWQRGDVADVKEGYDLVISRPPAGVKGERWKVDSAPKQTVLYEGQVESFKGWLSLLVNIPEKVQSEILSYEDFYKKYYGVSVDDDAGSAAADAAGLEPSGGEEDGLEPGRTPGDEAGGGSGVDFEPDDPFMGPLTDPAAQQTPPPAPKKAAAQAPPKGRGRR